MYGVKCIDIVELLKGAERYGPKYADVSYNLMTIRRMTTSICMNKQEILNNLLRARILSQVKEGQLKNFYSISKMYTEWKTREYANKYAIMVVTI